MMVHHASMPQRPVVIVGAGPAGAALALLLARAQIPTVLLERATDFHREFRGEGLQPSGLDILRQLGLQEQVEALPQRRMGRVAFFQDGLRLMETGPTVLTQTEEGARLVSQPALLEMLVQEAARFPHFTLIRGATVRRLLHDGEDPGRRVVGVEAEVAGELKQMPARLVIGADGRGSTVRQHLGIGMSRTPQDFDVIWCKMPLPTDYPLDLAQVFLGEGSMQILYPAYDDQLQLGCVMQKGRYQHLKKQGVSVWLEALSEVLSPALRAHVLAHRHALTHPFLLNVICDRAQTWTRPGVLLVGDAAHPMSPVGGQGINIALRDIVVAANLLRPVLMAGPEDAALDAALDAVCQQVQAMREPEIVQIQAMQTKQGRFMLESTRTRGVLLRLMPWLMRLPLLRWLLGRRARVFAQGLTPVRLMSA